MQIYRFGYVAIILLVLTGATNQAHEKNGATVGKVQDRFELHVQTHFSQGWNLAALKLLPAVGASGIRDGIYWSQVEVEPGVYDTSKFATYFNAARDAGINVLPVFAGTHPNYDDGMTPYTDEGRRAFARYVAAVVKTHPDVIKRIEIGNEYNTNGFLRGPFQAKPGEYFAPLAKEVALAVKAVHPETEIICTGAHSVATGYLRKTFEGGALKYCDAISFHPYRDSPENVDVEIGRLKQLMSEFGGEKPLYATEFGDWFSDPAEAPDFMLKMASLMSSVGVKGAYWYALLDEPYWPNMGVFSQDYEEKPAAAAFRFLHDKILPLGSAVALGDQGEDQIFRFGTEERAFVVWGAPATLVVEGDASYFDSSGRPIGPQTTIGSSPIVVMGKDIAVSISRGRPLYSAYFGHGSEPWSYLGRTKGRDDRAFQIMDGNWNPYIGHPQLKPMSITPTKVASAMFGLERVYAVERFTVPKTGIYEIDGRWFREKGHFDGADILITLNGQVLASGVVKMAPFEWQSRSMSLQQGDQLDFAVGPNRLPGGNFVEREIRIIGPE